MINNLSLNDRKLIINNLLELFDMIIELFDDIRNNVNDYQYDDLLKITQKEEKFLEKLQETNNQIMEFFTYFPLAKDLRRNVAYLHISDDLRIIERNSVSIFYFVNKAVKKNIELNWMDTILKKIIKRSNYIRELIEKENDELVKRVIDGDKKINELYYELLINQQEIMKVNKNFDKNLDKNKVLKKYNFKFVLVVKNFERIGDSFKEIAKWIYFINNGNFYNLKY